MDIIGIFDTLTAILLDPLFRSAYFFFSALMGLGISVWTILGWFLP